MKNVLVIYHIYTKFPLRQTIQDHLYCFGKYSGDVNVFYCNYAYGLPTSLCKIPFDLIIFHHSFTGELRSTPQKEELYLANLAPLKASSSPKVIFCQDELVHMERLNRFIHAYAIKTVYTVADPSQWKHLYPAVDPRQTSIKQVLTGYLDDDILKAIKKIARETTHRDLDIGYRATHAEPWLGRIGKLKIQIGEKARAVAEKMGLKTDISTVTSEGKFYHGLDWYRFMCRCKVFVGVEGGSSLLDADGTIQPKIQSYCKQHPKASFEEIEAACFPGKDGNINYLALSPRHLEACATKTCQVLVEGSYSQVLQPDVHYISVKQDFSNLEKALEQALDPIVSQKIVDKAHEDIVKTGKYGYQHFVSSIFNDHPSTPKANRPEFRFLNVWHKGRDLFLWKRMRAEIRAKEIVRQLLPNSAYKALKRLKG